MKPIYLECAKILNTHGVRGVVKAESWCDTPAVLASLKTVYLRTGDAYAPVPVLGASVSGRFVLLTLSGITNVEQAAPLKGKVLYAHRDDIPLRPGEMLRVDMIGLPVTDADTGRVYGTLRAVDDAAAGTLYTVATPGGDVLLPAVPQFVKEVTPDGIRITPIPGFFDEV